MATTGGIGPEGVYDVVPISEIIKAMREERQ